MFDGGFCGGFAEGCRKLAPAAGRFRAGHLTLVVWMSSLIFFLNAEYFEYDLLEVVYLLFVTEYPHIHGLRRCVENTYVESAQASSSSSDA